MKKLFLAFVLTAFTLISSIAAAQLIDPVFHRRTLFVPFGQERLMFEAPVGMCFLDQGKFFEQKVLQDIQYSSHKEILMASFSDCMELMAIRQGSTTLKTVKQTGIISWMTPYIGKKAGLTRQDYLDMREATFADYLTYFLADHLALYQKTESENTLPNPAEIAENIVFDSAVKRSKHGVMLGYTTDLNPMEESIKTVGVSATTTIKGFPVEFNILMRTETPAETLARTYLLMDKFIHQHIALNE